MTPISWIRLSTSSLVTKIYQAEKRNRRYELFEEELERSIFNVPVSISQGGRQKGVVSPDHSDATFCPPSISDQSQRRGRFIQELSQPRATHPGVLICL